VIPPALPARAALLLDIDGTLIDIAPRPELVVVPPDLLPALRRLRTRCADALAVVTGRTVEQAEALFGEVPYAIAGEHGAAIRHAPGGVVERVPQPELPGAWLDAAARAVAAHPGALLERKPRSFALHFRQAQAAGPALHAAARAIVGATPGYTIHTGAMMWEVRPDGADKGAAVVALMARPPFAGRVPVYIGDDVTDEDGIRAAQALGGIGLRVAEAFGDAAGVRAWLRHLAEGDEPS
jgi:trehalose 6-phosphate phosphatase